MIGWMKKLVKNGENTQNLRVRESYGKLAGLVSVALNLLLSAGKFAAGYLAGSVAITADAANNLSDAFSGVISALSFKWAGKPADREHPYGHARVEYLSSMAVAVLIFLIAFRLGEESLIKVLRPEMPKLSPLGAAILLASMGVKLWLFFFYRALGKEIDSTLMRAFSADSLSDILATGAVLFSSAISPFLGFSLDGYTGLCVALFIGYAGVKVLLESLNKLLGQAPEGELVELILSHLRGREGILGLHDLALHSYGPGRHFASLHVEVDARGDMLKSHDLIDNIERQLLVEHGIELVIHMDPVVIGDERADALREVLVEIVRGVDEALSVHDFRMVPGDTHTNLIFDISAPYGLKLDDAAIKKAVRERVEVLPGPLYAVITVDRVYAGNPDALRKGADE
ncbi:MAG: cation diffusion facilitator family transporter [Christensenellaceae bacterium]|jgi:cation diffusion facilitator family transporter|nr:cation diffusion facilitator family transporter [Christensenellaceae bacterium]